MFSVCDLNVSLNFTPTLESHELENCQERITQVVKIGDTVVGIFLTSGAVIASCTHDWVFIVTKIVVWMNLTRLNIKASIFKLSIKHLGTCNRKDNEKENQNHNGVLKHGQS